MMYLWLNLHDTHKMGTIGPIGSPVNFILPQDQHIATVQKAGAGKVDDVYLVYEVENPDDKEAGLQVIAQQKLGRNLRTRRTVNPPSNHWEHI